MLDCPGEISTSLSNWFFKCVLDVTPRSVLSSPLSEGVGVNWEPAMEFAGEVDTGREGGSDLSASISPWIAPRK